jgi:hypothetical protein
MIISIMIMNNNNNENTIHNKIRLMAKLIIDDGAIIINDGNDCKKLSLGTLLLGGMG